MISFKKSKAEATAKKHRHRYDVALTGSDEVAGLSMENKTGFADAKLQPSLEQIDKTDDVIYDLVVEDKPEQTFAVEQENLNADRQDVAQSEQQQAHRLEDTAQPESTANDNSCFDAALAQQVADLSNTYQAVQQQLEQSLLVTIQLTKQLEEKQPQRTLTYSAIGMAAVSLLLAIAVMLFNVSLQRDINDLADAVTASEHNLQLTKKEAELKTNQANAKLQQLTAKINQFFAFDNLDNVIATAKKLKQNPPVQPSSVLDLGTGNVAAAANLAQPNQTATESAPQAGDGWVVSLGAFKSKATALSRAKKFKKNDLAPEVVEIRIKNHTWYRVVAKSFTNKDEARVYAEQLKKSTGVYSISVARN